jgi:serine/threonine protein kinase
MTNGELLDDLQDLVGRELGEITSGRPRYVLEAYLDAGGFGAVYRGTDRKLDLPVAIKVGFSSSASRDFMREAKLAAGVQHNHIVKVSDYGYDKGLAFLVMEYLRGDDLEKLFEKQGNKLTTDQLVKFVEEVGSALAFAHAENLIHRDLKPRNIILKENSSKTGATTAITKFVLLDFGIASRLDSEGTQRNKTQDGAGTIEYMAPELLGKLPKPTPQSDIYAFGLILYRMMTGRVPFPQSEGLMGLGECLSAISSQTPPAFQQIAPDRSYISGMEELVFQCLEKEPARRPQTMNEVCKRFIEIYRRSVDTDDASAIPSGEVLPEDPEDLVGRVLDNRYLLEKFIDRGGYGAVYKGTDRRMEQPVAIKVGLSSREFKKEARLAAEVKHPNIVNVSDFGSDKGLAYLVMDFLHGETLEKLFERQGRRLLPAQLRQFVNEVGDALANAHDHLLIHRDLKPRNIILKESVSRSGTTTQHSRFVLFDFGIAAKIDSKGTLKNITQNGAGTLEYMAPELLEKEPQATPRSDIYAFGVILYQMMLGRVPFPQSDTSHMALVECLQAISTQNPPRFKEVATDRVYPAEMEALVMQCLEKRPERRPQSMAQVKERYIKIHDDAFAPPTPKPPTRVRYERTLRPTDFGDLEEESFPPIEDSRVIHPTPRSSSWVPVLSLVMVVAAISIVAWNLLFQGNDSRISSSLQYIDGERLLTVDEKTPIALQAGGSVELTFAVMCPKENDVAFSFDSKQDGLELKDKPGSVPHSRSITISESDPNSTDRRMRKVTLTSTIKAGEAKSDGILPKSIDRLVTFEITPPPVWIPPQIGKMQFRQAEDSWLCKIGGTVYATIICGDIGNELVRFRLIPASKLPDRREIPTFYIMENLVTNGLFNEFAKDVSDFELVERESSEERPWKQNSNLPVTDLYAIEAQQFAQWLVGKQLGSLPTVFEWQLAAGYYDFKKRVDQAGLEKNASLGPFSSEISDLHIKAVFGSGPEQSGIFNRKGGFLERRSPYGCQYPKVALEGRDPRPLKELTCTFYPMHEDGSSLRTQCQNRIPKSQDQIMRTFERDETVIEMRGFDKGEITWIKGTTVRSVENLSEEGSTLVVSPKKDMEFKAKGAKIGFRVVVLTDPN